MAAIDLSSAKPRERQARIDDLYGKCTFGSAVFFAAVEIAYFGWWPHPSFWLPTWDAIDAVIGRDFLNIWMGGRAALAGGPAAWFDVNAYNAAIRALLAPNPANEYRYYWSYPPDILLFTWPFGLMPYLLAYVSWCAIGIFAFVATAARWGGIERKNLFFVALAPAVAVTVFFGQNGLLTAALLVGGLALLDRKPVLAGVLFGVLTIKPQLGILLPVMLV
ncbi:MAG: glycosyltransferase family 87 protein, partial [Candidatus Acidiferrales bacterium]